MNEMTNSHILVNRFEYLEPTTVEDAVALLSEHDGAARVLAGGTDLIVQMKMERLNPAHVISINKIPDLNNITVADNSGRYPDNVVHIGALTTIRDIRDNPYIRAHYPALAEAGASFSTTQVQVMGTVGGNLCNASPASDTAPALIAYGARVVLRGPDDERQLPLEEFFVKPGKSALQKGELLIEVVLPSPQKHAGGAFLKMTRVAADLAKANAAVVLVRDGDKIGDCRVAFGSVAPVPLRARKTENALRGQVFSAELVEQVAQIAAAEITPIDDVRSTADYRRQVIFAMTVDALNAAWECAGREAQLGLRPEEALPGRYPHNAPITRRVEAEGLTLITLTVNGRDHKLHVAPNELLLNVIRDRLELTGAKYGCGIGECGACTVQMDGKPVLACLVLAVAADGHEILTVEGLQDAAGNLDPLQEAFIDNAAFQCGYCTPGMLMTAKALLRDNPHPSEAEVREYMKGNLCRCTGYASIVRAVLDCAEGGN